MFKICYSETIRNGDIKHTHTDGALSAVDFG